MKKNIPKSNEAKKTDAHEPKIVDFGIDFYSAHFMALFYLFERTPIL